ncbi:MAG: 2-dehydropantoate 2-reductase [Candidatus Binatia bacterium]|nr:2-dehydropantoate 2-reductase [Candidatus Binatia bacterium]
MRTGEHRIALLGCGGVGGTLAAYLARQGKAELSVVTHNPAITRRVRTEGLELRERGAVLKEKIHAVTTLDELEGQFDFIFLAMQPPQLEDAVLQARHRLSPRGAFVVFQNGLCEQRVAALVGPERVIGAIVAWGASMVEPGVCERTSPGGFTVGTLGATPHPLLAELCRYLERVGPVRQTQNLLGARWSKLAINCAISSLGTIGGERLGVLLRYRFARRLGLEVITEAVAVARALGIRLEKVAGTIDLHWVALTPGERFQPGSASLLAKHALLLAVGARFRRLRSSMLAAVERGREPAVDFINGEVVRHGAAVGVPTPLNERVVAAVHDIARRKIEPSVRSLYALYQTTMNLRSTSASTELSASL